MNTASLVFTETGVFSTLAQDPALMAGAAVGGAFICSVMFVLIQKMDR